MNFINRIHLLLFLSAVAQAPLYFSEEIRELQLLVFNLIEASSRGDMYNLDRIMKNPRFQEIEEYDLGDALRLAAKRGHKDIVVMFMKNPIFDEIRISYLEDALFSAVEAGYKDIARMILQSSRFHEIHKITLGRALLSAAENGHEIIVRMFLQNLRSREIDSSSLESALVLAVRNGHEGCANLIQAYTALKPERELKGLSLVDKFFISAYEEFLAGNPQDLRNLIYPIARVTDPKTGAKSDIYPFFQKAAFEQPPLEMIKDRLLQIFKKDHIKPLLLSLAETESQKKISLYLLDMMGLTKKQQEAAQRQQMPTDTGGAAAAQAASSSGGAAAAQAAK